MANNVDPDEMARYKLSILDLHYFHKHLSGSSGLKGLTIYIYQQIIIHKYILFLRK